MPSPSHGCHSRFSPGRSAPAEPGRGNDKERIWRRAVLKFTCLFPMKLLITAGPTREPIDPARFISNRSSGKMGYAVAAIALKRGHSVILISGPVALKPPKGVRRVNITTAADMLTAVRKNVKKCDALIMAAAVSDFRPAKFAAKKLKKSGILLSLPLKLNPDILKAIAPGKGKRIFVGFAAETGNLRAEALRKLREKNLDLIVANDISRPDAGFETDTNRVTLFSAGGEHRELPLMAKEKIAERIVQWIEQKAGASLT
ncbi:MAG: bifunctional phosphopantothenoylcysteine decarboxylase/phosphopantothenate--cysteine ligase CoaBC [Kiritimatiellia bacterium]|nr:bifunctional phosphopantothenoylcysteine decarboxylase/phosphopantothenate--cysteine ligase CoaBC [Kiritimatiellia bacterium]